MLWRLGRAVRLGHAVEAEPCWFPDHLRYGHWQHGGGAATDTSRAQVHDQLQGSQVLCLCKVIWWHQLSDFTDTILSIQE